MRKTLFGGLPALVILLCVGVFPAAAVAQEEPLWFETESIPAPNDVPDRYSRETPRQTLRAFLRAFADKRYDDAATLMKFPEGWDEDQDVVAYMLGEIIDRNVWLAGRAIPDTPAGEVDPDGSGDQAPQPKRSIEIGSLELDWFPASLRLSRYKAPQSEPVWLFSEQTVEVVPELFDRFGPGWLERRLPDWWTEPGFLDLRRWELVSLPLLFLIAGGIYALARWCVARVRDLLGVVGWRGDAFSNARGPLALFCASIFVWIVTRQYLKFSGEISAILEPVIVGVSILSAVATMLAVIDTGLDVITRRYVGEIDDRVGRDDRHLYTSIYALRRAITLIAFLLGVGLLMWELGYFHNIGLSLLASAGVLTVVLGIAGRTVLGNILSSLQIAMAKPIRIGDSLLYEGNWCYVEAIYFTFVCLRTWDERRLIVPVQYFVSQPFENWSMTDAKMARSFILVLDHIAEGKALREKFLSMAKEDEDCMKDELMQMQTLDHTAEGVHFRFYATAADPSSAWDMHARLRESMLDWIREEHPEWWPRERVVSRDGQIAPDD
ncbi:Small-conductance mechanosensitive channel [Poseidonocella pacifica]|uniref:Small-conductance mechanosensitive channel n=1 Tax=Poseidonocella pacifica TaxID=871651 RepID=A0A1I0YF45_9RHOB|nr:mechanosensitive ion channel domain-containing protein [Poseidonocella pacifica]SFB10998.1 Small-conductance mechanosensitive channel [Poseidonocella pacifica]